jgi:hypothetical protein
MSIKSTELRIGNWFLNPKNEIEQVYGLLNSIQGEFINPVMDYSIEQLDGYNESECNPIPLTPKILINNCGFIKRDVWYSIQPELLNIEYRLIDFNGWIFSIGFYRQNNEITNINYLHELQNLYFDISHEELKIKDL